LWYPSTYLTYPSPMTSSRTSSTVAIVNRVSRYINDGLHLLWSLGCATRPKLYLMSAFLTTCDCCINYNVNNEFAAVSVLFFFFFLMVLSCRFPLRIPPSGKLGSIAALPAFSPNLQPPLSSPNRLPNIDLDVFQSASRPSCDGIR